MPRYNDGVGDVTSPGAAMPASVVPDEIVDQVGQAGLFSPRLPQA
jgi:hypothetical protein